MTINQLVDRLTTLQKQYGKRELTIKFHGGIDCVDGTSVYYNINPDGFIVDQIHDVIYVEPETLSNGVTY